MNTTVKMETQKTLLDEGGSLMAPSHFFIINALGDYVFFKTRSRQKAQASCDAVFGKGKYTIRTI